MTTVAQLAVHADLDAIGQAVARLEPHLSGVPQAGSFLRVIREAAKNTRTAYSLHTAPKAAPVAGVLSAHPDDVTPLEIELGEAGA